ncbi:RNA polymerase I-specific transcription initiation factor RRN3 [Kwoniella heveanensis BCC8398]|uniref:RNA polymerase I-specific transcription initiation factor RRN3 n=1 Tax=Kwoniella heveanensis BCC8398 TaxID=1296120 RepID=A0A1B9H1Q0_9TREE|nr:RNA polymerase I-specific transcription initiation factor RRN3 [Kwoniella heveanensis BCC8398]
MMLSHDPSNGAGPSRSSSLAGRKRPRESEGDGKRTPTRRTKSTGDAGRGGAGGSSSSSSGSTAKDREAFQRGLIAVFVPKALQESKQGNMTHYNDLLSHFLPTPTQSTPSLPPLLPLLRAISAHVSLLSPGIHGPLVTAIISLPWATGDEKFVKTFVGWAAVLVSAQPGWAKEVVGMAVKGLTWQPCFISPNSSGITRRIFHARHHLLLSHLISLVPTLPNVLQPLLIRNFPHKREPEVAQTTWIRNCCELIAYCPELGGRVWGEIVDRMLRIDVEITNSLDDDDEDEDSDDDDEDEDDIPTVGLAQLTSSATLDPLDLLISQQLPRPRTSSPSPEIGVDDDGSDGDPDPDELSSDEGDDSDDEDVYNAVKLAEAKAKKRANVKSMREKLDGMLVHFFEHLEEYMGVRESHLSAAEMAAQNIAGTSGASTPTSEYPLPSSSAISSLIVRKPPPTTAQSLSYFHTLLNLFSRQILPTSATQHIPFLLFLTSSFSPAHTDLFLGLLVSQALYAQTTTNPSPASQPVSMNQRIAATVYIGSVVCRARFVNDDQARTVLTYLLAYIDGKLHQSRISKRDREPIDELPLFYAVCQAVMLIFCFRWRAFTANAGKEADGIVGDLELEEEGDEGDSVNGEGHGGGSKWMSDLDVLQRAITSELNPLLGCNPTIVSTFAKVAHHTNFAYCFSIIEANQQSSHPARSGASSIAPTLTQSQSAARSNGIVTDKNSSRDRDHSKNNKHAQRSGAGAGGTGVGGAGSRSQTMPRQARALNVEAGLDSYFPFDPYDLPRSKRYVERLYRTWAEVAIDAGNDDSDSDSDSDSESDLNVDVDEEGEGEDSDSDDSSLEDHMKVGKTLPMPMRAKVGSYGEHRKRFLGAGHRNSNGRDGGLSSSLEGMSISPSLGGGGGVLRNGVGLGRGVNGSS